MKKIIKKNSCSCKEKKSLMTSVLIMFQNCGDGMTTNQNKVTVLTLSQKLLEAANLKKPKEIDK